MLTGNYEINPDEFRKQTQLYLFDRMANDVCGLCENFNSENCQYPFIATSLYKAFFLPCFKEQDK